MEGLEVRRPEVDRPVRGAVGAVAAAVLREEEVGAPAPVARTAHQRRGVARDDRVGSRGAPGEERGAGWCGRLHVAVGAVPQRGLVVELVDHRRRPRGGARAQVRSHRRHVRRREGLARQRRCERRQGRAAGLPVAAGRPPVVGGVLARERRRREAARDPVVLRHPADDRDGDRGARSRRCGGGDEGVQRAGAAGARLAALPAQVLEVPVVGGVVVVGAVVVARGGVAAPALQRQPGSSSERGRRERGAVDVGADGRARGAGVDGQVRPRVRGLGGRRAQQDAARGHEGRSGRERRGAAVRDAHDLPVVGRDRGPLDPPPPDTRPDHPLAAADVRIPVGSALP